MPLYNTAAVVQRTGVPAATFRAWERRYRFPSPHRQPAGQRLYAERDIQAIRWLQQQTQQGVAISRAVEMLRRGYAQPAAMGTARPRDHSPRSLATLRAALADALHTFDTPRAEALVAEATGLFGLEDACLHVLDPVQAEVAESGQPDTAASYATSFLRTHLIALLGAYGGDGGGGPLVLSACAPGDWHETGLLLLALLLARRGCSVRYLGPDLPVEELWDPLTRLRPAVLVLSADHPEAAHRLAAIGPLLRALPPPPPRFAYGGPAFAGQPGLRAGLPGTYLSGGVRDALRTIERLISRG